MCRATTLVLGNGTAIVSYFSHVKFRAYVPDFGLHFFLRFRRSRRWVGPYDPMISRRFWTLRPLLSPEPLITLDYVGAIHFQLGLLYLYCQSEHNTDSYNHLQPFSGIDLDTSILCKSAIRVVHVAAYNPNDKFNGFLGRGAMDRTR